MERISIVLPLVGFVLASCGPRPYLTWRPGPYDQPPPPHVELVQIMDRRAPDRGGGRENIVQIGRTDIGIPRWLNLVAPYDSRFVPFPFSETVRQLIDQAFAEASVAASSPTRVSVELLDFWCDGYLVSYSVDVAMDVLVLEGEEVRWRIPERVTATAGDCRRAYSRALTAVRQGLAEGAARVSRGMPLEH